MDPGVRTARNLAHGRPWWGFRSSVRAGDCHNGGQLTGMSWILAIACGTASCSCPISAWI